MADTQNSSAPNMNIEELNNSMDFELASTD